MSNEKTDWWVGLFVLLGAIALTFLALRAGNLSSFSFAPTYSLTAKFDNIGGLKVRAPVKSAGVVVGRVASITLDEKTFQTVKRDALDDLGMAIAVARYRMPGAERSEIYLRASENEVLEESAREFLSRFSNEAQKPVESATV